MAQDFDRINGTEQSLDRAQKRIQDGVERGHPPFHQGVAVDLDLSSDGDSTIAHKLGRKPQGYFIMQNTADGAGTLSLENSDDKSLRFKLHTPAGAPTTKHKIKLWVY